MGLQISVRESGDVTILDLRGRSTIDGESELLDNRLRKLIANGVRRVLLNLTDLTKVDSSGVGVIIDSYVSLRDQGGDLKLLCPRGRVLEVLKVLHPVKKEGAAKKMIALVLNLFAADVFLDASNLFGVHTRPRGELGDEWTKNYLVDVDTLAFLTDHRSPLRVLRTKLIATVLPSPRDLAGTETVQTEIRARPVRSNAATH